MDVEAAYWLALLLPVWALFFFLRSRLGVADAAWSANARSALAARETLEDERPRERPGHCSSCGAPIDDAEFDRCWRCAAEVHG